MKNLKLLTETFLQNMNDDPLYDWNDVEADFLGEFEREELRKAYKAALRKYSKEI